MLDEKKHYSFFLMDIFFFCTMGFFKKKCVFASRINNKDAEEK